MKETGKEERKQGKIGKQKRKVRWKQKYIFFKKAGKIEKEKIENKEIENERESFAVLMHF